MTATIILATSFRGTLFVRPKGLGNQEFIYQISHGNS